MSDTEVGGASDDLDRGDGLLPLTAEERPAREWVRSAVIVGPLVLGLLVVAAVGARMLTAEIPDRSQAPPAAEEPERCWDRTVEPDEGCPLPSGRAGLRWVFPSFKPGQQDCHDARPDFPRSTRPVMYACTAEVEAGEVTIVYSRLTEVDRGRANYEKRYGEPEQLEDEAGKRLLWREDDPGPDGVHDLAVMYAALPFAVDLSADSPEALDEALESLVRFRPAADLRGHR